MSSSFHNKGAFQTGVGSKAGGFAAQKFFHPSNHRNQEKMWLFQQKEEEMRKKQEELQMRREEERKMEEHRKANAMMGQGSRNVDQSKKVDKKNLTGGLNDMFSDLAKRRGIKDLPPEQAAAALETQKRLKKMKEDQARQEGAMQTKSINMNKSSSQASINTRSGEQLQDDAKHEETPSSSQTNAVAVTEATATTGSSGGRHAASTSSSHAAHDQRTTSEPGTTSSIFMEGTDETSNVKTGDGPNILNMGGADDLSLAIKRNKKQVEPEVSRKVMAKSAIYTEDKFESGHTAVFGSYYENGQWGYACCKFVPTSAAERKRIRCSLAPDISIEKNTKRVKK